VAAWKGKTEVVVELVKAGANVDMQDEDGDSAVIFATLYNEPEALKELVAAGANLNLRNQEGLTALMISARGTIHDKDTDEPLPGSTIELTDILLSGATIDPDIREDSTGWTALFFAAEAGDVATTQSLIRAGANVHIKDKDGLTALDVASGSGKGDSALVCEVLSKHMQELTTATHHDDDEATTDQDKPATDQVAHEGRPTTATLPVSRQGQTMQDQPTADQDSSTPDQDKSTADHDQDTSTSDQDASGDRPTTTTTSPVSVQVLKNLVNTTRRKLGKLFDRLNRRHKLMGQFPSVRGQERGGEFNIMEAMKMREKYTPETTVRTIKSSRNL
jgi:hypothetical protein